MAQELLVTDHRRDIAGLTYVYPVISRRAGGLSIGINVNTNNACNWRCVYCQVPHLIRGAAPDIDLSLLEEELRFFIAEVLNGHFYQQMNVAPELQMIKDIAISGNGEPTSLKAFDQMVALIGKVATELGIFPESNFVLITNGSLLHQGHVQEGLKALNTYQGEVWFKLDSVTQQGKKAINDSQQTVNRMLSNLEASARLCATSLQMCMIDFLSEDKMQQEYHAYLEFLSKIKTQNITLKKIVLYSLARPSLQPEANQIKKIEKEVMEVFADNIRALDYFLVEVS